MPVHPTVMDVALNKAVSGVPPKVNVTFVSSVLVRAAPVTSVPLILAHTGAADTEPVPV